MSEVKCECFWTPPETWLSAASCGYGSGYEPGSQMEWNPDCPVHTPEPAPDPAVESAVAEQYATNLRVLIHEADTPMRGHDDNGECCLRARFAPPAASEPVAGENGGDGRG